MSDMTKEAIQHIQDTSAAAKRVSHFMLGNRVVLYNDRAGRYEELEKHVAKTDTVSNIESFIALVLAEADRRSNETGERMNVIFTDLGATLTADTDDREDVFYFRRTTSSQWQTLTKALDTKMTHRSFVLWLQKLEPSVSNYVQVLSAFRTLSFTRAAKLLSEPLLHEGAKGSSFEVRLDLKGGAGEVTIPQFIDVELPFARGDARRYAFTVQIDVNGGQGDELTITPFAPAVDLVREQAIVDEMLDFKARMEALPKLTTLVNF